LASFPKLDALLISHIHADHFSPDHIKALAPTKLFLNNECLAAFRGETGEEGPDGIEIVQVKTGDTVMVVPGVQVDYFTSDHGPNITAPVENLGWILRADGKVLYFPGDMFNPSGVPTADLVVDYALLPVGGFYTFGPQEAVNFADTFRSIGSVIPMHYEKDALNKDKFVAIAGERYNVLVD
jgi:L-ascorbate metabolism protein UlaG (beta-lactamase superfamily)